MQIVTNDTNEGGNEAHSQWLCLLTNRKQMQKSISTTLRSLKWQGKNFFNGIILDLRSRRPWLHKHMEEGRGPGLRLSQAAPEVVTG